MKLTIPISDHRYTIVQSQYVKGTKGVLDTTGISISDPWISPKEEKRKEQVYINQYKLNKVMIMP